MNIDRIHSDHVGEVSHLEALYRTIPSCEELLAAVRAGHAEFRDMLAKAGLLDDYGLSNSTVHDYRDIEVHAFTVGIVSEGRWDEVQTKSFLTYASHWIDDFFDSPAKVIDPGRLLADRRDIRQALANMGRVGQVGFAMANRARHPAAVYKALHRMLYGGLVQRAADYAERHALVEEYPAVATQFVDPRLVAEIRHLQPEAYWTTNKSVLELLNAAEEDLDFNTSELWNLVYASALYYEGCRGGACPGRVELRGRRSAEVVRDAQDDPARGEVSRADLRAGSSQMWQVEFVARAIPNLPDEVVREYRSLWSGHRPTVACA